MFIALSTNVTFQRVRKLNFHFSRSTSPASNVCIVGRVVVGRCVYTDTDVLGNFVDVGGEVDYLQEAASDVYKARRWIFGFGFVFATVSTAGALRLLITTGI